MIIKNYSLRKTALGVLACLVSVTAVAQPTVVTTPAASISGTSAVLTGTITANGPLFVTGFDLGTTTAYGTPYSAYPSQVSGATPTNFNVTCSSLSPNTTYHYRAVAYNSSSGTYYGADATFTTQGHGAPAVVSSSVDYVPGNTYCRFRGVVNANNVYTDISVEYGLTTAYGMSCTSVTPNNANGGNNTSFYADTYGLQLNQTYHYRAKATNNAGTDYSGDSTFYTGVPAGIKPVASSGILLYPNPVINKLTVDVSALPAICSITVSGLEGKIIPVPMLKSGNFYEINTSSLTPGIYWLQLHTATDTYVHTLLKQ